MSDEGLTTCGDCGNDLTAPGGITVYYRLGLPGSVGEDGLALPHPVDELLVHVADAEQDAVVCAECGNPLWEK